MCSNGGYDGDSDAANASSAVVTASLPWDTTLELVAHYHRREILRLLIKQPDHVVSIDELTTHLVDHESERTGAHQERTELETTLYHVHLPKLIAAGIVEYDARFREMRYWPHERIEGLLEYLESTKAT